MDESPRVHEVEWTPQKIGRFWDWFGTAKAQHPGFGGRFGPGVLRFAEAKGGLRPTRILDIGAGDGQFLEVLVKRGYEVAGVDLSPVLVDVARARLAGRTGFVAFEQASAVDLPFANAEFGAVVAMEVVEHLRDEEVSRFFAEAARVLRPGGTLVISTPNDEDLDAAKVVCPDCGARFHPVQHLQRWSIATLDRATVPHGFRRQAARELPLSDSAIKTLARRVLHRQPTNLLFVARRTA